MRSFECRPPGEFGRANCSGIRALRPDRVRNIEMFRNVGGFPELTLQMQGAAMRKRDSQTQAAGAPGNLKVDRAADGQQTVATPHAASGGPPARRSVERRACARENRLCADDRSDIRFRIPSSRVDLFTIPRGRTALISNGGREFCATIGGVSRGDQRCSIASFSDNRRGVSAAGGTSPDTRLRLVRIARSRSV